MNLKIVKNKVVEKEVAATKVIAVAKEDRMLSYKKINLKVFFLFLILYIFSIVVSLLISNLFFKTISFNLNGRVEYLIYCIVLSFFGGIIHSYNFQKVNYLEVVVALFVAPITFTVLSVF
ncbi:MAG: hypothetical protein N4A33_11560 [Bacteriovoracaceae bacterium]|jgi:hypothetical protein|nr:hypothetical protein [Bacteriovoracaceae bacterium]